jgi:uncharacterized membrane protein
VKEKDFSITDALVFGWHTFRKNILLFVGILIVCFLTTYVPIEFILGEETIWTAAIGIVRLVVKLGISLGFLYIVLKLADHKKAIFSDLFSQFKKGLIINYFIISVIVNLLTIAGLVLLIIPGVIVIVRYGFFPFALIEENLDKRISSLESMKKSWNITKGYMTKLLLFGLVLTLINGAGLLVFGIGLLITIPVTMVATAYVYRRLSS